MDTTKELGTYMPEDDMLVMLNQGLAWLWIEIKPME